MFKKAQSSRRKLRRSRSKVFEDYDFVNEYQSSNYEYMSGEEFDYNDQYQQATSGKLNTLKK
jgi:hypothetical protein